MTERADPAPLAAEAGPAALAACPHLVSVDGPWHAATPSRAHRCRLLATGRPTLERQQAHCLGPAHLECPTWVEAHGVAGPPSRPGPFVATAPVVLEGPGLGLTADAAGRRLTVPVTLIIAAAALGAFVLARGPLSPGTTGAGEDGPPATPGPSVVAATAGPTASATPAATARPAATPIATPVPEATPRPTTYKVRAGDTLTAIAARFGTSVAELAALNGIKNTSLIRVGQVLRLP